MNILLLLLATMLPQSTSEYPHPVFIVKTYPQTIMPGDTLNLMIIAKNPHVESIYIMDHYLLFEDHIIQFQLRDSEKQTERLRFEAPPVMFQHGISYAEIKPGDSRIICMTAINVPPLEDLKEPFWEKHIKNLSDRDENLMFCTTVMSIVASDERGNNRKRDPFTFETSLTLKPRPEMEMALIQKWLKDSPKELLPGPYYGIPKVPPLDSKMNFAVFENINVKGEKIPQHGNFTRSNNRYPGYPNSPETWQGWKELEGSLAPSTMRDEIRLARILIQYCDTEDEAVLKELKEWFANMNLIQRSILIRLTRKYEKIHDAVKEYDIFIKESNFDYNYPTQYLKDVGLLE